MAVETLSPWPPTTTPTQRAAAVTCLKDALPTSLTDNRANQLGMTASELVERYASNAPQAIKNEAVIRCAVWMYQMQPGVAGERYGEHDVSYVPSMTGALRHSGATGLLSAFKVRRAGKIENVE